MLHLSHVLIANQDIQSFDELKLAIKAFAKRGEMYLRFDIKPPYPDTPNDWEEQLEMAFNSRH